MTYTSQRHLRAVVCLFLALLAGVVGLLAAPPAEAPASTTQAAFMMDDNLLLYGSDRQRYESLVKMKAFGVEGVRVTVLWSVIAENAMTGRRQAARFKGWDGATYPRLTWDRYDRLVQLCKAFGIAVLFNVTGPGPPWAHQHSPEPLSQLSYRPKPRAFYDFVRALGTRYSGTYRDENDGRSILPRVGLWSIWNEPNQGHTLTPQSEYNPIVKKVIPTAPIVYRQLVFAATAGLAATGHARDVIALGETAPLGKDEVGPRKQLRPKLFIREFFCIKPNGRPYTGLEAKARQCDRLRKHAPILASAWAHHPYTQRNPPNVRDPNPDSINTANLSELGSLLDTMARRTGKIRKGLPIVVTENAWQSRPPDPVDGISLAQQAEYLDMWEDMAYRNPRVAAVTWFLLRDVDPRNEYGSNIRLKWFTWQSGLLYRDGSPKPSLNAYVLPFSARYAGRNPDGSARISLWGQSKSTPKGTPVTIYVQYRLQGSARWVDSQPVAVSQAKNFFQVSRSAPGPAVWRAVHVVSPGVQIVSREVMVSF